ncbi:hypothetical protein EST38_g3656 [Candolleomyces aberdarensis]|uniref:Uncharacterized protein n=1 Tax=Candolleomyces aberdarensis TaxID=2316362 RepID=A0A4Q2DPC7_9AGAR|nr:hypothetical protein EST38_g3656 [Candolleomyces aberdarensis]
MPGGRYLVTFQQLKWLSVWDLRQPSPPPSTSSPENDDQLEGFRPTLLLRHNIAPFDSLAYIDSCVDGNTVRFLIKQLCEVPEEISSALNLDTSEGVPTYDLLQLSTQDGNVSIERLGRLIIVYPEVKYSLALSESEILFQTEDATMIWDASQSQASVWLIDIEDTPEICGVFTFSNHVLYITAKGVYGVERPPSQPIGEDWIVLPTSVEPRAAATLRPSFFIPHELEHTIDSGDQVSGPNVCNPRFREHHEEVFYEITEFEPLMDVDGKVTTKSKQTRDPISVYRYLFTFDSSHPEKSTLKLTESAAVSRPPGSSPKSLPPGAEVELAPVLHARMMMLRR